VDATKFARGAAIEGRLPDSRQKLERRPIDRACPKSCEILSVVEVDLDVLRQAAAKRSEANG
jgi:hypothetical protein